MPHDHSVNYHSDDIQKEIFMLEKTQGVYDLVEEVLKTMREPYGEDIIEDVCLAIESHPNWRKRYNDLALELSRNVVNQWIGSHTRQITGLKTVLEVNAKRSKMITSYTKLRH
jgi:hypothetical protein